VLLLAVILVMAKAHLILLGRKLSQSVSEEQGGR
jgi:hypothetical protein